MSFRLLIFLAVVQVGSLLAIHAQTTSVRGTEDNQATAASISFGEFLEPSKNELKVSAKLQSLNGRRVKLIGFMAQMEVESRGSFYLVPRPVFCDEEGGGDADLPPGSVLVLVKSLEDRRVPFISGLLEVTGTLLLGNHEKNGQVTAIRLTLDETESAGQFKKLTGMTNH